MARRSPDVTEVLHYCNPQMRTIWGSPKRTEDSRPREAPIFHAPFFAFTGSGNRRAAPYQVRWLVST
jgi:hypothetical protein